MTEDFEVNKSGTMRRLDLREIALRAALSFIDCHAGDPDLTPEMIDKYALLNEARALLGDGYQQGEVTIEQIGVLDNDQIHPE